MTTSRYKKHIAVCALALVGAVVSGAMVYRALGYITNKTTDTVTLQQELRSYQGNKKIFADEALAVAALRARVEKDEAYIIRPATMPTFLSAIEALATRHGVTFVITSAQTPGKQKDKLTIDFSVSGNFEAVTAFLKDLSKQTYQTKLSKLSLFADRSAATGQWSALGSIQIISFSL